MSSYSAQFLGMLESLRMPAQFQQGRRYARAGHVRSLTISSSLVTGLVLDDDGGTYRARIAVRAYSAADWHRIERALAGEAIYAAKLLAGSLPDDLDQVLAGFGLSLFPSQLSEIALECSCQSWHQPCAHLAATCYALGASFDADPFGILAWRGRTREELLGRLRPVAHVPRPAPAVSDFWTAGPRLDLASPAEVLVPGWILEQLDPLGLTVGRFEVDDLLRRAYRHMQGTPTNGKRGIGDPC